jgi:hypothetical protein
LVRYIYIYLKINFRRTAEFLKDIIARHMPKGGRSRSAGAGRRAAAAPSRRRKRRASSVSSSSSSETNDSESFTEYYDSDDGGSYGSYGSSASSSSGYSGSISGASFSHLRPGVESTVPGVPHVLIVSHKGAMVSMLNHMLGENFKTVKNTAVFSVHVHSHNDIELVRDHDIAHLNKLMPAPPTRGRECAIQ